MITEKLLLQYGAWIERYNPKESIFQQGQFARNFYQIKSGRVLMKSINEDGKEFIQGVFQKEESFGEPPLFADISYPASAVTASDAEIMVLPKKNFLLLLAEHPSNYLVILKRLSRKLHYKSMIAQVISNEHAEDRILTLIDYMKKKSNSELQDGFKVPLTRQQIADLIGLRVETVIRTISALKKKGQIKIHSGKIIR